MIRTYRSHDKSIGSYLLSLCTVLLVLGVGVGCGTSSDDDSCPDGQERNPVTDECSTQQGPSDVGGGDAADAGTSGDVADSGSNGADTSDTGGAQEGDTADSGPALDTAAQDTDEGRDSGPADRDTASNTDTAGQMDSGTGDGGGSMDAASGAVLEGTVTRKDSAMPAADGKGHLYIAVMDKNPITMRDSANLVGFQLIKDTDFTSSSASYNYRIDGIPPSSDKYFVTAFLDDDGSAKGQGPKDAGPDSGDLVALDSTIPPEPYSIKLDSASTFTLDLVLKFNMI